jgi:hypothetical protein
MWIIMSACNYLSSSASTNNDIVLSITYQPRLEYDSNFQDCSRARVIGLSFTASESCYLVYIHISECPTRRSYTLLAKYSNHHHIASKPYDMTAIGTLEDDTTFTSSEEAAEVQDTLSLIRTQVRNCLAGFQCLLDSLNKADEHTKQKLEAGAIEDQRDRFTLWSRKAGVHLEPIDAPNYMLDLANPIILSQVIQQLERMQSILHGMSDIVTGKRPSWEDLSETDSDTEGEKLGRTELEQLAKGLASVNTKLKRLTESSTLNGVL